MLFNIPHAAAVDIGIAINPISVRLSVKEPDVVAIITNVSNDFNIENNVSSFLYFFSGFVVFISEVSNHSFNVVDMVIKIC